MSYTYENLTSILKDVYGSKKKKKKEKKKKKGESVDKPGHTHGTY